MKKFFVCLMVFCVALTSCAFAEESAVVNELNWSDYEAQIQEAGWEGEFITFDQIAVKMWVPSVMTASELAEEDLEAGYIAYFVNEDESTAFAVQYVDLDGMELADYAEMLPENGASEVEFGLLNGIEVLMYKLAETDVACVTMMTQAGYALEFAFGPVSDKDFAGIASLMVISIQAAE